MALLALKVSLAENGRWIRNMVSPAPTAPLPFTSENTIHPLCQAVLPEQVGAAADGLAELHTETV